MKQIYSVLSKLSNKTRHSPSDAFQLSTECLKGHLVIDIPAALLDAIARSTQ